MLHFGFTFALLAKHCPHVKGPLDSQLELVYIARLILHERAVGRNNLAAATGIRIAGRLSAAAGRNIFFYGKRLINRTELFLHRLLRPAAAIVA
jgi:hypothetical protein